MKLGHAIANFFSGLWNNDLEPALKALLQRVSHDAFTAAVPIAQAALQELIAGGEGVTFQSLAIATAKKIGETTLEIAEHDSAAAVAGVLALHAQAAAQP